MLRVKNGFSSDWMPGGYRDVKVSPVVNQHVCEIQLQLRDFFALKSGQHVVYTWARDLKVAKEVRAEDLFEHRSPEVTEEMVQLARQNWNGTAYCLSDLQVAAGQYDLAETGFRQVMICFFPLSLFSVWGTSPIIFPVRIHLQLRQCATRMPPYKFWIVHQKLSEAEDVMRGFEDQSSKEWREALLRVNTARASLGIVLEIQVWRKQFDPQTP